MKKKHACLFVAFFLSVIFMAPVVQAVYELKKNNAVQSFDILTDAVVTPFNRATRLHGLAVKQSAYADSLCSEIPGLSDTSVDNSHVLQMIDDAQLLCSEMKKTFCTINRHISIDSTSNTVKSIDSFSQLLSRLQQAASARVFPADTGLNGLKFIAAGFVKDFVQPGVFDASLLTIRNLRYIFWNDKYLRPFEKEMENNSIFANTLRPCMQYSYYVLFNDPGEKGIVGKNGWLFYKPDVDFLVKPYVLDKRSITVDPNDKPVSDNPILAIKTFKKQLQDAGVDLLVVIIPGKPCIYPDLVTSYLKPADAGSITHSGRMIEDLNREGIETVDLFKPFSAQRAIDGQAGDSMYMRKDTHWKARAVMLAAHLVAERIKNYPWYCRGKTEYGLDTVDVDRMGDVAVMTTLQSFKIHDLSLSFATEKVRCYRVNRIMRDSLGNETGRVPYKDDFHSSQILLLGDSFSRIFQTDEPRSAGWIAHIAYELSQPIASIVNDGGASTLVRQSLAHRINLLKGKKLVVWEIVERDFRFGSEGWKDVPLQVTKN
jgi:hypothetical protein